MYCLPIWVLIHYWFFAQEPDLQWLEIKSLWVRVIAGMLIATAMGVLIRKSDRINSVFIFAFFGMSISIVWVFVLNSLRLGHLITPNEFLENFLFDRNKVGTAFFSVVDLAVGCASLITISCNNSGQKYIGKSIAILVLMGLSIGASVIVNSKNGVGVGSILVIIFIIWLSIDAYKNHNPEKLNFRLLLIGVTIALLLTVALVHKNHTSAGWGSLLPDIKVAFEIDKYQAWKGVTASNGEPLPKNSLGKVVAANIYERYAWIAAGSREIIKHPMGYGLINHPSFPRWLKEDGLAFDGIGSTHSGWVDLGLAFGYPALFLSALSFLAILIIYIRSNVKIFYTNLAIWISLAILMAGFVQEVTYKQTFEALVFFMTFSAASFAFIDNKNFRHTKL